MTQPERQAPQPADIGLAAVMERIDALASEIGDLSRAVDFNTSATKKIASEGNQERVTLANGLDLIHEETSNYNLQFVSAFTRLSNKQNEIIDLLNQIAGRVLTEATPVTRLEDLRLQHRPYRAMTRIMLRKDS